MIACTRMKGANHKPVPKALFIARSRISSSGEFLMPPIPRVIAFAKPPPKKKTTSIEGKFERLARLTQSGE